MRPYGDARCILVYLNGRAPLRRRATAVYSWTVARTYTLTITATKSCGEAVGSFPVEVSAEAIYRIYLPLVVRDSG